MQYVRQYIKHLRIYIPNVAAATRGPKGEKGNFGMKGSKGDLKAGPPGDKGMQGKYQTPVVYRRYLQMVQL